MTLSHKKHRNAWVPTQHYSYWCPGTKPPGHLYQQCWLNTHFVEPVLLRNITFTGKNIWKQEAPRERKPPPRLVWEVWNRLIRREISSQLLLVSISWKIHEYSSICYSAMSLTNMYPENRKMIPVSKGLNALSSNVTGFSLYHSLPILKI